MKFEEIDFAKYNPSEDFSGLCNYRCEITYPWRKSIWCYNEFIADLLAEGAEDQFEIDIWKLEDLREKYRDDFDKGYAEFDLMEGDKIRNLWGSESDVLVPHYHNRFFHNDVLALKPWRDIISHIPNKITLDILFEIINSIGYYSGWSTRFFEIVERNAEIFQKHDNCPDSVSLKSEDQKIKTTKNKKGGEKPPPHKGIALYYFYSDNGVTNENKMEYAKKFKQMSGDRLKQDYDKLANGNQRRLSGSSRYNLGMIGAYEFAINELEKDKNTAALKLAKDDFTAFKLAI